MSSQTNMLSCTYLYLVEAVLDGMPVPGHVGACRQLLTNRVQPLHTMVVGVVVLLVLGHKLLILLNALLTDKYSSLSYKFNNEVFM